MILPIETKDITMKGISGAIVYAYFKQYPDKGTTKASVELGLCKKTIQQNLLDLECAGYIELVRQSNKEKSKIVHVEILK